jgi:hypothetical protein
MTGGGSVLGRLVMVAVFLAALAWVVKDPQGAAHVARAGGSAAMGVVSGLSAFFDNLAG